jgi:HEAT repeat protein/CRP-like cAMP-binding protein
LHNGKRGSVSGDSPMTRYLNRLFNIRTNEWPRLLLLYVMAFLFLGGITWGELTIQASFLFEVGYETLPQVFVANAVVSTLAIAIYILFVDHVPNAKLLIAISTISALVVGVSCALLGLGMPRLAYPLLYILSLVVRETFNLQWWTYVNSFYDIRSAKRIIPVLATASRMAVVVFGQTMPLLNVFLSSGDIILLWMGILLVVALLAWLMPHLLKETSDAASDMPVGTGAQRTSFIQSVREGYRYVSRSSYLRWLALSTLLVMLLLALVEYRTSEIFVRPGNFTSQKELSSFLGRWSSWASLILLPFQLFALSRLVGRIGLGNANLIFPIGTLAICGSIISWPRVITAALGYLDIKVFRSVFHNPMDNLLHNAVPLRVKARARAFIAGLVAPLGSLIGGGLLLLSQGISVTWFLPGLIGATAAIYVISALFVRRQYPQALLTMLEQEDFSFLLSAPSDLAVTDAVTLNWLKRKLEESPSSDLIFVAKLISEVGGAEAVPIVGRVAREEEPDLRSTIIDILAAADVRGDAAGQLYAEFVGDPDRRVRRSAIAGLEQWAGSGSEQYLDPALELLHDPDIEVRAHVIPSLIRSGDLFYQATAFQALAHLLADEDPHLRARGVRVLSQVGDARFIRNLVQVLIDSDDQVRLEAAIAIETLSQDHIPDQIATLIVAHLDQLLQDPVEGVRRATITILGHIDTPETHQALVRFLTDSSPQIREAAIQALVAIGKPIIPILSPSLDSSDPQLQKMATIVLGRVDQERFEAQIPLRINDNLRSIYRNYDRTEALRPYENYGSISVLRRMLREQNDELIREVFRLLAATHNQETAEVISESLRSESARMQANAIEALESLTTPQIAALVASLFDRQLAPADAAKIGAESWDMPPSDAASVVRALATDPDDAWARTIMAFALGEMGATLSDRTLSALGGIQRRKKRRPLRAQTATLFDKLAHTSKEPTHKPGARPKRPPDHARPGDILDMLVNVPEESPPRSSTEGEHQARGDRPADLLDRLLDVPADRSSPPDGETAVRDQPIPKHPPVLSLEEIESMLEVALDDPVADVRIAARAARRMIADVRVTDVTPEEETVLSTIERIIFLKEATLFQGMTVDRLKVLATMCEEALFPKDTVIFNQGDPGGAMYVVVSGKVSIERKDQHTDSAVHLATIDPYACFGEMSLFDNCLRSVTARANQDTLTLRLCREPLVALIRRHPDLGIELINVLSQRLRDADDNIAQLSRSRSRDPQKLTDQSE